MAPNCRFLDDSYVTYIRKCIVFPANGAEPHLVNMTIRTVTEDDTSNVGVFSRTVDLRARYGSEYRKTCLVTPQAQLSPASIEHIFYYNLSPKLPLNRCLARIIGINADEPGRRLFWRGDMVVMSMKYDPRGDPYIIGQNAKLPDVGGLAEMLRDLNCKGHLERKLDWDEETWKWSRTFLTFVLPATFHHPYWGYNWKKKEVDFLNDMNELREIVGCDPIVNTSILGGLSDLLAIGCRAIQDRLPSFFLSYFITGLPETVVLSQFSKSSSMDFGLFMATVNNRPRELYSKNVRNLWILAQDDRGAFERILTLCSGVENLVPFPCRRSIYDPFIPFLQSPNAGSHLRRLTCRLEVLFPPWSGPRNFHHPLFAHLTHLHLHDEAEDWSRYGGFENLRSLTHLALSCCGPKELAIVTPKLPVLQYVALCHDG